MHIEVPFSGLSFESMMFRIAWERLLASFMFVAPVARNAAPFDTAASSAAAEPVKTTTVISFPHAYVCACVCVLSLSWQMVDFFR